MKARSDDLSFRAVLAPRFAAAIAAPRSLKATLDAEMLPTAMQAPGDRPELVKLPVLAVLAIAAPRALESPRAVAVNVTAALEATETLLTAEEVEAGTVTSNGLDAALHTPELPSVAVNAYDPADKSAVVKLHAPVLLAIVVPNAVEPPTYTVIPEPCAAAPFSVTELLELTLAPLMLGDNSMYNGFDAALVPPEVVSVAVNQ